MDTDEQERLIKTLNETHGVPIERARTLSAEYIEMLERTDKSLRTWLDAFMQHNPNVHPAPFADALAVFLGEHIGKHAPDAVLQMHLTSTFMAITSGVNKGLIAAAVARGKASAH